MAEAQAHPLESILQYCQSSAPEPWYPKLHAEAHQIERVSLDPPCDELRLAGYIELTDWMQGKGQGYRLTQKGRDLLANGRAMAGVRTGQLPAAEAKPDQGSSAWERGEAAREAVFYDDTPPSVRNALIVANVVVFLAGMVRAREAGVSAEYLNGEPESWRLLRTMGALYGEAILAGEWWRILTSCFLHSGWAHLIMNMFGLFAIGGLAERMWGHLRFLILYLLAGLGGSCLMLAWQPQDMVVGASGAICGVFAGQAVWLLINRRHLPADLVFLWMRNLIIVSVLLIWMSMQPGVALLAHLGGVLAGAAAAGLIHFQKFGTARQRRFALAGLILVPFVLAGMVQTAMATTQEWERVRFRQRLRGLNQAAKCGCLGGPAGLNSYSGVSDPSDRYERGMDAADLAPLRRHF